MTETQTKKQMPLMEQFHRSVDILRTFFRFGWFTFGGGWSVVAQIQKEYVEKKKWITTEELMDFASVGRSFPGMMVSNACFLFGYYTAGIPGAIAALLGMSLPAILCILVITTVYSQIRDYPYVSYFMRGVSAAVAPIIISIMVKMVKASLKDATCIAIMLIVIAVCLFTSVSAVWIIFGAAIIGLVLTAIRSKK